MWYTSAFKESAVRAAAIALTAYDIDRQASASDLFKPSPYYHTLRDVKDATVTVFQALHAGAAAFFADSLGVQLDELVEDMHYLPQVRFSTLHVHYRRPKVFSSSDMSSRHRLLDVVQGLGSGAPQTTVVFMYVCRFNSFHAMWQLMCEGSIPCERLDFGPCAANRAPVFVVGGDARASPLVLATASDCGGLVSSDLLCADSTASLSISVADPLSELAFAAAPRSVTALWRLGSDPDHHTACYVFETKNAYMLGLREMYASEPLPAFLAAIITGSCAQELRASVEGTKLFAAVPNDDGSGWLICPNVKYHVPTVPISNEALREDLNFVAWWIARSWWPQVAAAVAACTSPIVSMESWDAGSNITPSTIMKPVGEPYLHTIRDCTSSAPLVSLLCAAESFFLRFGVRLCDLKLIDSHYPPLPRYGTLHVHFRTRRSFNDVVYVRIQSVVKCLETAPFCLTDGSIRFMYPHHTGRAVFRAFELGLVSIRYLNYGSRSPTALPFHVRVGPSHEVDDYDTF